MIVNQQLEIVPFKPGAIPNLVSSSIKDHAGLQGDSECTMRVENSCTVSPMKVEVVWLDCCCFCGLFACWFVCLFVDNLCHILCLRVRRHQLNTCGFSFIKEPADSVEPRSV